MFTLSSNYKNSKLKTKGWKRKTGLWPGWCRNWPIPPIPQNR